MLRFQDTTKIVQLALLTASGLIIFVFETYLPRPFPWAKPGLANIVSLLTLYWFGWREAILVLSLRVGLGALIVGTLFNPVFLLSLGGGLTAILAMILAFQWIRFKFSLVGISVLGAFFHVLAQLVLAALFVVRQTGIFYLMPIMLIGGVFTGIIVGLIAQWIVHRRIFPTIKRD